MELRIDVILFGRLIGTTTEWNHDVDGVLLTDFQPVAGVDIPKGNLRLDWHDPVARVLIYAPDGRSYHIEAVDVVDILNAVEKQPIAN